MSGRVVQVVLVGSRRCVSGGGCPVTPGMVLVVVVHLVVAFGQGLLVVVRVASG